MKKTADRQNAELLDALHGDETARRQALQYFFENPRLLNWTVRYVRDQGGSEHDGHDVFSESFILFERQVRHGHFRGQSSLETYFHGIVRWQWLAHRRKTLPVADLDSMPDMPGDGFSPEKMLISDERRVILSDLLTQVGERCQKLLGLYQLHYSMREISEMAGYASEQVAANEVHGCRKKLKKLIHRDRERLETLKDRT